MLDLKFIRENLDAVRSMLRHRNHDLDMSAFEDMEQQRRTMITEVDAGKQERNRLSKQIGALIKQGQDVTRVKEQVRALSERIGELEQQGREVETQLQALVDRIPNMLDPSVPVGLTEDDNVEVDRVGEPPHFDFPVKDHVALGADLGILDFETAAKITGARFVLLRGDAAKMERALIHFMIDVHSEQGYFEVLPPFIVHERCLYGTGQFPKMREDVFRLENTDYYLIPTAEVPVTNIHREEILDERVLPLKYQAFTPCFRSEAGAYGKDTRGLIRQHQFNKVELVKLVHPDHASEHLESLRADAEEILKRLGLAYRVMALCSGDLSFSAAKCYDLEVWLPGQDKYREISSCSHFTDFQARRARIRFKDAESGKNRLVHTLNGSGLAVGRTLIAIMENYQDATGRVHIPEALVPYMNGQTIIEPQQR